MNQIGGSKMQKKYSFMFAIAIFVLLSATASSWAANYPARPIELIVAYSPGSGTDVIARALANTARKYIEQPVVVINKAGGGGVVGNEYVINAKPDGYSVLFGLGSGETLLAPHMQKLPHNPVASIKTVLLVTEASIALSVNGDSPYRMWWITEKRTLAKYLLQLAQEDSPRSFRRSSG
jgi:tripartite-type tricarboxylate transporter receptor subunit TctC